MCSGLNKMSAVYISADLIRCNLCLLQRDERRWSLSVSVKLLDTFRKHLDSFNLCFATKTQHFNVKSGRLQPCWREQSSGWFPACSWLQITDILITGSRDICSRLCVDSFSVCGRWKNDIFLREATKNRYCRCYVWSSPACSARPQAGFWVCLWQSKYIWW